MLKGEEITVSFEYPFMNDIMRIVKEDEEIADISSDGKNGREMRITKVPEEEVRS